MIMPYWEEGINHSYEAKNILLHYVIKSSDMTHDGSRKWSWKKSSFDYSQWFDTPEEAMKSAERNYIKWFEQGLVKAEKINEYI